MSVPSLRFPEFNGEWKPSHANDAFTNSKAKGEAGLPIYSVTLTQGLVRRDSLDRHMAADAADETNLRAQKDELVYNMMRMWQGAVGKAALECMVSPAYVVLTPKAETSSDFFNHWFQSARMLYLLWAYSHGLTSDRLRLYFRDFEPRRVCGRLQTLRRWSHDKDLSKIFSRSSLARGSNGAGSPVGLPFAMGGVDFDSP